MTTKPFCFPNLGGITINPGMYVGNGHVSAASQKGGNTEMTAQYQAHYYVYPLFYLLELLSDFICFEQASFDLAYMTELDPTWQDDTLAALVYPETVVFDFPLAQVACAADCVAATAALPLDALFWCAGCNGSMYPMTGNIGIPGPLRQIPHADYAQAAIPATDGEPGARHVGTLCLPAPGRLDRGPDDLAHLPGDRRGRRLPRVAQT